MHDFPNPDSPDEWDTEDVVKLLDTINRRTDVDAGECGIGSIVFTFDASVTRSLGEESFRFEMTLGSGDAWLHHRDDDRGTTELWSNKRGRP